jgi:hypothetical protein
VGLLLSTSSARESHEWEAFQSGVFSYEVRSGLSGAADANGDGRISYREIAAFIERANAPVLNERFRPEVHARPPQNGEVLVDLNAADDTRLLVGDAFDGHLVVEDDRGVRMADLHNGLGRGLSLLRPKNRVLFVRQSDSSLEYRVPAGVGPLSLAELPPSRPRVDARGAEHEAFSRIFSAPFDRRAVDGFRFTPAETLSAEEPSGFGTRRWFGVAGAGLGVGSLAVGGVSTLFGHRTLKNLPPDASQQTIAERNASLNGHNQRATAFYVAGGALLVTGITLLLWPESQDIGAF